MPCKTLINSGGETYCSIGKRKTKHACIVDADESLRIRLEGVPKKCHEDHILLQRKEKSPSHYYLVHKFIPSLKHEKYPAAKAAVELFWENWKRYRHGS